MWRWIIAIAEPETDTNTAVGRLIGAVVVFGWHAGRRLVAFIPPCTHVILMEEVITVGTILRLHGVEIISTCNNHRIAFGRGWATIGEVETDVGIVAHIPHKGPYCIVGDGNPQLMLTTIVLLIKCIDLRHDDVHIGRRLHIDHHLMRTVCWMNIRYLIHVMQCWHEQQCSQNNTEGSRTGGQDTYPWAWLEWQGRKITPRFISHHKLRRGACSIEAIFDKIVEGDHGWLQSNSRQQHHGHGHMDHQPGHFLSSPGVEEDVAAKPVGHEETEARRLYETTYQASQSEDDSYLFIQRYQEQVVVPGLSTTRYLLLLYPVVDTLPDTITNTTSNVGEKDGKQHQKDRPAR